MDLLFYSLPTKTEKETFCRRLEYIRLIIRWQDRKESPRRGVQMTIAAVPQRPVPKTSTPVNTVPARYNPLQCPFCLSNQRLPPTLREMKKSKINKLWDHVENLHREELTAFATRTRQCGLCSIRNDDFVPSSVPNFKNHTQIVYGIRLRPWGTLTHISLTSLLAQIPHCSWDVIDRYWDSIAYSTYKDLIPYI